MITFLSYCKRHQLAPMIMVTFLVFVSACSSTAQNAEDVEIDYLARSVTKVRDGLSVTASVPSRKETRVLFNKRLYQKGIQPVWLEIQNDSQQSVTFLPVGLDAKYFSPMEAANVDLTVDPAKETTPVIDERFFFHRLHTAIAPGDTRSGFVFTSVDEGSKSFNVDLVNDDEVITLTFLIPVPGLNVDHYQVDWANLYPENSVTGMSKNQLIDYLESQTCCTTDKKSKGSGDPLNLVVIGDTDEVYTAFLRAGWDETREFLVEDLAYGQALDQFAYVRGAQAAAIEHPRGNLSGDPYFTDGYRVVLWVTSTPVDITAVNMLEWRIPNDL